MPDFSTAEEVHDASHTIFKDTQQAIPGLEDLSFSYGVLEGCFAHIRKYLHFSSKIVEGSVQVWFYDARILPKPLVTC